MNYIDKILFYKDVEEIYKKSIRPLYLKYKQYSNAEIREEFSYWVATHNHQKNLELVNRRKHRKLKYKAVKSELDTLKTKEQLANFV